MQGIGQHGSSQLSPGAEPALAASFLLLVGDPETILLSREAWEAQSGSGGVRALASLLLSQLLIAVALPYVSTHGFSSCFAVVYSGGSY